MRHPTVMAAVVTVTCVHLSALSAQTVTKPTYAQSSPDPPTALRKLLQSGDPREQAWGAWYAGRDQIAVLVPAIQRVVEQHHGAVSRVERAAADTALDTLIQFGARLPAELIAAIYASRPAQAMILASLADDDANAFLLDVLRSETDTPFFAAANILIARKAPGVAAALLSGTRLRVTVYISDDRSGMRGGALGGGSSDCRAGEARDPMLPPVASYVLSSAGFPGLTLLAEGPTPVFYRRSFPAGMGMPAPGAYLPGRKEPHDSLRYLAALAGEDDRTLPLRPWEIHSVVWRDETQLAADLQRIREDVARRYGVLVTMLVARKLLSAEDAPAAKIELDVVDLRRSG